MQYERCRTATNSIWRARFSGYFASYFKHQFQFSAFGASQHSVTLDNSQSGTGYCSRILDYKEHQNPFSVLQEGIPLKLEMHACVLRKKHIVFYQVEEILGNGLHRQWLFNYSVKMQMLYNNKSKYSMIIARHILISLGIIHSEGFKIDITNLENTSPATCFIIFQ